MRLNIDNEEIYELEIEYFYNTIVVMDDVEKSTDKTFIKWVIALREQIFEAGRHHSIDIISVSHDLLGGNLNKTVKAECTGAFLFPQFNQPHQSKEYMRKYLGFDNNTIIEIMKLPSRWVYISTNAPNYYISEKKIKMLV